VTRQAVALAALVWLAGCGSSALPQHGAAEGFDVLLVTLDTTRADRLGCYGHSTAATPTIDGLARSGVRFENAATVAPLTAPAHASILTGLYPPRHGLRANGPYRLDASHETLAETLGRAGYETAAFVSSFVLDHRFGFDQGFTTYDDRVAPKTSMAMEAIMERDARGVTDAAESWMRARESGRPYFAWVHYFDPHVPYGAPAEFASKFPESPYDAEVAYVDAQLGRLVAALEQAGRLERTLIVVVADHGEALGQHGELSHGYFVYDEVVRVPLILSARALFPRPRVVSDVPVTVSDVVPTVLDLLGVEPAGELDGRSLTSLASGERDAVYVESLTPYLEHGWSPLFALRGVRFKYIDAPRPEFYDLSVDAGETENRIESADHASVRDSLGRELGGMLSGWPKLEDVAGQALELDEETRARLVALGYSGETRAPRLSEASLDDPKDRLADYDRFLKASFAADTGNLAEALPVLRELAQQSPGNRAAWNKLAEAYALTGHAAEAEATLRKALSLQPDPDGLMLLAQLMITQQRLDEVGPLLDRALAIDPDFGTAIVVRGDLAVLRGRYDEAAEQYRLAQEVDPYRAGPLCASRFTWLENQRAAAATE
jgi:arylsulfatase A-like enzyme